MSKPLRNPKHEKFARAIVLDGKEPAEAYVIAGFERDRANHWKLLRNPIVEARVAQLTAERELAARAARTPAEDALAEFEKHGIEQLADFYQPGPAGALVVRDLGAVRVEVALALLHSLHEAFGIHWEQSNGPSAIPEQCRSVPVEGERRPQDWIAIALEGFFADEGREIHGEVKGSLVAKMALACAGIQGEVEVEPFEQLLTDGGSP